VRIGLALTTLAPFIMGVVLTLTIQSLPRHGKGWRNLTDSLPVLRIVLAPLPGEFWRRSPCSPFNKVAEAQ